MRLGTQLGTLQLGTLQLGTQLGAVVHRVPCGSYGGREQAQPVAMPTSKHIRLVAEPARIVGRSQALAQALALAADQEGVVSRRQLAGLGVPRWVIRLELRTGRWQATGRQTLAVHNGPLAGVASRRVAVLEVGRRAALDGVSALQDTGITGLDDVQVHVITPKGSTPLHPVGVRVHESRLFREADLTGGPVRRMRAAVAAVHAAQWARTDREATYLLLLTVQQRAATWQEVRDVVGRIRRHRRRTLLRQLVVELSRGVHSLGELDVARDLRRQGLPEPERQVLRRRPSGTEYLDCDLPKYGVGFEIDGAGHDEPWQRLSDLLRDITTAAEGHLVVRIPLEAYVLDRERVLDALERLLISRGWQRSAA